MKIIQSFWSCNQTDLCQQKSGWLSSEYNLMSWALSCLQLKKYYGDVSLYADSTVAKLLIETLKLPYSSVICELDSLNRYHPKLWALPKIYAYSKQEKPFLHVDGDVFIWGRFDECFLLGGLIAQNMEISTDYYEGVMISLESKLEYFPPEILNERGIKNTIYAYNAGIMGGHDIEFFQNYTSKAFEFVNRNASRFSSINVSSFNIFFEQYLFYCLAKQGSKQVNLLFDEIIGDNRYKGLSDFSEVPYSRQYLHLLGNYKTNQLVCDQLASQLRFEYPEYYYRIISLFKEKKIPLFKDYYWFESDFSENSLLTKHPSLEKSFTTRAVDFTNESLLESNPTLEISGGEVLFNSILANAGISSTERASIQLRDLKLLESTINKVVKEKFSFISRNYLLARDIHATQYSAYVFGEAVSIYDRVLVASSLLETIETQFEWTILENYVGSVHIDIFESLVNAEPTTHYTIVIPECHQIGYAISGIDQIDCLILETLKEPKTVEKLFDEIKAAFDADDLANSSKEFEKLIFGRIKKGFLNKSILAVTDSQL